MLSKIVYLDDSMISTSFDSEKDAIEHGNKFKETIKLITKTVGDVEITVYKRPLLTVEIGDTQLAIDVLKFLESKIRPYHYTLIKF